MIEKFIDIKSKNIAEAMLIANNPLSTADELETVINISSESNKIIAAHSSVNAEILSKLIRCKEYLDLDSNEYFSDNGEASRIALRNPKISVADAFIFGEKYPDDFFMNPSIDLLLKQRPELLLYEKNEDLSDNLLMLQAKGCPMEVLHLVAGEGTRREQAAVSKNPNLPVDLKTKLTPEFFYERDLTEIARISENQDAEEIRDALTLYSQATRPFCTPRFLPLDRSNSQHRIQDQIFCGFPFTCADFPWPIGKGGHHMQPIAQIDLLNASRLIDAHLGEGLLQIWGGIEFGGGTELMLRVIPYMCMQNEPDEFYPANAPWLNKDMDFEGCIQSCFESSDFPHFGIDNCRIDWDYEGEMFYPKIRLLFDDPIEGDNIDLELSDRILEVIKDIDPYMEDIDEKLDSACISRSGSLKDALGRYPLVILGGYPQGTGNAWSSHHKGNILFYHSIDYGVMVTIGVTYDYDEDGKINFHVNSTCDN